MRTVCACRSSNTASSLSASLVWRMLYVGHLSYVLNNTWNSLRLEPYVLLQVIGTASGTAPPNIPQL
ncbi:hypothetical protein RRG08_061849 [Elysia crispata]|uniref:Uncharacterized protein n=1 Tax=Elysia crispata TaxID=231223 RepID=A0AAE1AY14_9GAST|nr:hypothetical protein RRG08_061849 [Elysia crispata]